VFKESINSIQFIRSPADLRRDYHGSTGSTGTSGTWAAYHGSTGLSETLGVWVDCHSSSGSLGTSGALFVFLFLFFHVIIFSRLYFSSNFFFSLSKFFYTNNSAQRHRLSSDIPFKMTDNDHYRIPVLSRCPNPKFQNIAIALPTLILTKEI
jgi:hypothetical protein